MDRRTFLATTAGLAGIGVAGCVGRSATPADAEFDVGMTTRRYVNPDVEGGDPQAAARVTVQAGETVVWRNTSTHGHTVTAFADGQPDGAEYFASGGFETEEAARQGWRQGLEGRIDAGETYEHTFEVPGEHDYFCIPHIAANMVGTVVVE
jgi:plastocyanin